MGGIGEHHRDIKNNKNERKNRKKKLAKQEQKLKDDLKPGAPHQRRRCWDWIILTRGAQYAKNRSSFKTYRRIRKVKLSSGIDVLGLGTVELDVLRSPNSTESHTLILNNVLHTPNAICNGIMIPQDTRSTSFRPIMQGYEAGGRPYWYGTPFCGLSKLALAGNHQGESLLQDKGAESALVSLVLDEQESAKCYSN